MISNLDYNTVVFEFAQIVDSNPHYNYLKESSGEECSYFDNEDGSPSCVVGHWLALHNIGLENIEDNVSGVANLIINNVLLRHSVDDRTMDFLEEIQALQDDGSTWGEAFNQSLDTSW